MKQFTVKLKYCNVKCIGYASDSMACYCTRADKVIDNNIDFYAKRPFPEWCPLEDVEVIPRCEFCNSLNVTQSCTGSAHETAMHRYIHCNDCGYDKITEYFYKSKLEEKHA